MSRARTQRRWARASAESQSHIAGLKVKSILIPKLGDINATKLTTA
jgi:hypothetical protein